MKTNFGLKGRIKAFVTNGGVVVRESEWTRNLWLDQGLNNFAETPLCDLFLVAVKGTGTTPTKEDLSASANTYSIADDATTLTRTAGTRDFTVDDIGKLIRFASSPFAEFTISAITDVDEVEVSPAADADVTDEKIVLHNVQQTELTEEVGRTNTYSASSGENSTVTAGNTRTFKRTFVFPTEDTLVESVPSENVYSQAGTTVTRDAGTRDFSADDVGATIRFVESEATALITAFIDASNVTVDPSQTVTGQNITLTTPSDQTETVTGTYSRSGATVTRVTGARDFTADDVGKVIHFNDDNVEAFITVFTDASHVDVDETGTLPAQEIVLYGFTDYTEIGFSDSIERDDNLNIRVLLNAPVRVYVSTGLQASDQLKLTYECELSVNPDTSTPGNLSSAINDPGNLMSGNKNGDFAIESFATSTVIADGSTSIAFADLEPFYEGFVALSLSSEVIAPLSNKIRSSGTAFVPMTGGVYDNGSFERNYTGVFGLNDAINNNWRTLMLYDPSSQSSIFAFVFDAAQKKDGNHTLTMTFNKNWGRDLS